MGEKRRQHLSQLYHEVQKINATKMIQTENVYLYISPLQIKLWIECLHHRSSLMKNKYPCHYKTPHTIKILHFYNMAMSFFFFGLIHFIYRSVNNYFSKERITQLHIYNYSTKHFDIRKCTNQMIVFPTFTRLIQKSVECRNHFKCSKTFFQAVRRILLLHILSITNSNICQKKKKN